jgi:ABC-type long-subunit fatty acid transport system fused permease/ATPase subunit
MFYEYFCHERWEVRLPALFGCFIFLVDALYGAWFSVWINAWSGRFFDLGGRVAMAVEPHGIDVAGAIQSVDITNATAPLTLLEGRSQMLELTVELARVACVKVALGPVFGLVRNRWVLAWRVALISSYLRRWRADGPHVENIGQRVHEDTGKFAAGVQTVCATLLHSALSLGAFVPILLALGRQVCAPSLLTRLTATPWPIDAWLVATACTVSIGGLGLSAVLGAPLIGLEVENQRVEADLRRKLVLLESSVEDDDYRLGTGCADCAHEQRPPEREARKRLVGLVGATESWATPRPRDQLTLAESFAPELRRLVANYRRLYRAFCAFAVWLGTWEQAAFILPYAICGPLIFAELPHCRVTMGTVSRLANAFHHVVGSLTALTHNWCVRTYQSKGLAVQDRICHRCASPTPLGASPSLPCGCALLMVIVN